MAHLEIQYYCFGICTRKYIKGYFHFYTVQELRYKSKTQLLAPVSIVFRHKILKHIHTHIKMLKFHKTPTCFGPRRTIFREYVKPC